jgi:hypothetical protein
MSTVLERCAEIIIKISLKKFRVATETIFAGYVANNAKYGWIQNRAVALTNFLRPKDIYELRSFKGLAQQTDGCVPELANASDSEPLRQLFKIDRAYL